jgi:hypothetical protein
VTHHHTASLVEVAASQCGSEEAHAHIHKVDFNRLQIREKKRRVSDASNRFRVDFKQEEAIDLRDFECEENTEQSHEAPDISDKVFARKFVDQIAQFNSSRLNTISCSDENLRADEQDTTEMDEYETLNFGRLTGKSSLEILESLHNLKDIGKHLTESVYSKNPRANVSEYGSKLRNDLLEINEFLVNNERSSVVEETNGGEDEEDSLRDGDGGLDALSDSDDVEIPIESRCRDAEMKGRDEGEGLFETRMVLSPTTSITIRNCATAQRDDNGGGQVANKTDDKVRMNRRY